MVLPELTVYLEAQSIGTQGSTLFYGYLPDSPDACVVLLEYPGLPNEPKLGTGLTNLEFPKVQVLTRGVKADQDGPRLKIQQVITAMTLILNQNLSGISYKAVMAQGSAFPLKVDDNFRHIFACNFQVTKAYSSS